MGRQTLDLTGISALPSLRPRPGAAERRRRLETSLVALEARFGLERLGDDPLLFPRRYADPADREVVALVAALFAYGRVGRIRESLEGILAIVGPSPARTLAATSDPAHWLPSLNGWRHRFNDGRDVASLLHAIGTTLRAEGSLEELFLAGDDSASPDLLPPLGRFAATLRSRGAPAGPGPGWPFLVSDPTLGGASKRWNLFLRWVVRRGPIDLDLWHRVSTARLTLPLDAHVGRISRLLGLTRRRSTDWKAAREATDALARIDPADPIRFDFAICRLGILAICQARPRPELCALCELADCCPVPRRATPELRSRRTSRP